MNGIKKLLGSKKLVIGLFAIAFILLYIAASTENVPLGWVGIVMLLANGAITIFYH